MAAEGSSKIMGETVDLTATPRQGEGTQTPGVPSRVDESADAGGGVVSGQGNVLNRLQDNEEQQKKDRGSQEASESGGSKSVGVRGRAEPKSQRKIFIFEKIYFRKKSGRLSHWPSVHPD